MNVRKFGSQIGATLLTGLVVAASLVPAPTAAAAVPPIVDSDSTAVTADALPTAQIDGVVWAQLIVGDTVYAGGDFTTARPAGSAAGVDTVKRSNLLAYNLQTGELTDFAPRMNAEVRALAVSPDQQTLYVGGAFSQADGVTRSRFAAFDLATGELDAMNPAFNSRVNALAVTKKSVFAGGWFTGVDGNKRGRLAALTLGGTLRAWAPEADGAVAALVTSPDQRYLVVGGSMAKISGTGVRGMGRLGATSGKVKTWRVNKVIKTYGSRSGVTSLSADKDTIYGSTYGLQSGNLEGVFAARPSDGKLVWMQDCHGDQYGVVPVGSTVYSVGHAHYCTNIGGFGEIAPQRTLAVTKKVGGKVAKNGQTDSPHYTNHEGQPAPSIENWFPTLTPGSFTGLTQAAWSIAATKDYVVLGGEFTAVNGTAQQGLVRFAVPSIAPNAQGPMIDGKRLYGNRNADNQVELAWQANWDRDDKTLYYAVYRDGVKLTTIKAASVFWDRQTLSYTDTDPGDEGHTYQVRIRDKDMNIVWTQKTQA